MKLPVTRYYGSKRKLLDKIWDALIQSGIEYNSVLDLFGGTSIVSYYMRSMGKEVVYNDIFAFNCQIAQALLATPRYTLTENVALSLLQEAPDVDYLPIIENNFANIYYTNEENHQIDIVVQNIKRLPEHLRASAYYILFQSCMIKRPFNLFHRKNLNLRLNHTESKFGNAITWEQTFADLFIKFTKELNEFQFVNKGEVKISNSSALTCNEIADLIYIDTPYFAKKNTGNMSYHNRYHFLEGLMNYENITNHIDADKINKEIEFSKCKEFECRGKYLNDLDKLINKYQNSIIAFSYNTDGYPSVDELQNVISKYKRNVTVFYLGEYAYALNKHNKGRNEILIVGQ